jgi:hypothetical protein
MLVIPVIVKHALCKRRVFDRMQVLKVRANTCGVLLTLVLAEYDRYASAVLTYDVLERRKYSYLYQLQTSVAGGRLPFNDLHHIVTCYGFLDE